MLSTFVKLLIIGAILFSIIICVPLIPGSKSYQFGNLESSGLSVLYSPKQTKKNISQVMQQYLDIHPEITDGSNGTYAIYIDSLEDDDKFSYNENEVIDSASLYKLVVLAGIIYQVEKGNITLDTPMSDSIDHLTQVYGEVDSGYEDAPAIISYTVEGAMERITTWSDNFAAIMLTDEIYNLTNPQNGANPLQSIAQNLGMNSTRFDTSYVTTTASDIDLYFEQLYNGQIGSKKSSDKIIDLLKMAQNSNRIPALLPQGTIVAHKTGELDDVRNDAGIVYMPNGQNYIIVLMSKDDSNIDSAINIEAGISKVAYDYFDSKK